MWKDLEVTMAFQGRLCGSVPQSKELVSGWLNTKMPKTKPDDARPIEEVEQELLESIQETEERTTLGFQRDEKGLFVRGGTIKAHLKDCANQIKDVAKVKALRSKVANRVYLDEYKVYLRRNGDIVREEDGSFEQPVHVMTGQGPRNALKVIRYIDQPELRFKLKLLDGDKEVKEEMVRRIFEYGSVHGYGGERGMGEGRYTFEMK